MPFKHTKKSLGIFNKQKNQILSKTKQKEKAKPSISTCLSSSSLGNYTWLWITHQYVRGINTQISYKQAYHNLILMENC